MVILSSLFNFSVSFSLASLCPCGGRVRHVIQSNIRTTHIIFYVQFFLPKPEIA